MRRYATPQDDTQLKDYAFEMAASSIRFGPGSTREVGMDVKNLGAKRVCVVTDETVDKLTAMEQVREALTAEGINFRVFNQTRVEPKDSSCAQSLSHSFPFFCLSSLEPSVLADNGYHLASTLAESVKLSNGQNLLLLMPSWL